MRALEGRFVRLEPLSLAHLDALCAVGLEPSLWQWTLAQVQTRADMQVYIEAALHGQEAGTMVPFATVERASGQVVGSTRFGNIDRHHRRVEIGWTWLGLPWQRTALNTEAKLLMLTHAFEVWQCVRVEFKTNVLNEVSRRALLRLGATEEGILRRHMVSDAGVFRDSVYYSLLDTEWPSAKARLEAKLAGAARGA
jgi:RimJ/RimL family protein N-acetyltransferase